MLEKQPILKTDETVEKYLVTELFFEDNTNVSTVIFDKERQIKLALLHKKELKMFS